MLKKTIASLAIGATVLGAGAYAADAYASTPAGSAPAATVSAPRHTSHHALRGWLKTHRKEIRRDGVAISANTIGITPKDLRTELRSGRSIADVAAEHGVSTRSVVDALVGAADKKVNEAVTAKKLTAAQATKLETRLQARITKAVDRTR